VALVRAGRGAEAIAEFERVLRVKPDYAAARDNLAAVRRR
jgi:Flp pilus assembly protein TadD